MSEVLILQEFRCKKCGHLLYKGAYAGVIETKCEKCKELVRYEKKIIIKE